MIVDQTLLYNLEPLAAQNYFLEHDGRIFFSVPFYISRAVKLASRLVLSRMPFNIFNFYLNAYCSCGASYGGAARG